MHHAPYARLGVMVALSFVAMYVLMYAMVNALENVFHSVNQVYMAGLMAASMVPIELAVMRKMYPDARLNLVAGGLGVAALAAFWMLIRVQGGVGDRQFLRSMIPHHAGAILMCEQADLSDAQIRDLCGRIIENQRSEIDEMRAILRRLDQTN